MGKFDIFHLLLFLQSVKEWAPYHPSKGGKKKSPGDMTSMTGSTMDLTAGTPSGETPAR